MLQHGVVSISILINESTKKASKLNQSGDYGNCLPKASL